MLDSKVEETAASFLNAIAFLCFSQVLHQFWMLGTLFTIQSNIYFMFFLELAQCLTFKGLQHCFKHEDLWHSTYHHVTKLLQNLWDKEIQLNCTEGLDESWHTESCLCRSQHDLSCLTWPLTGRESHQIFTSISCSKDVPKWWPCASRKICINMAKLFSCDSD
jgi:hypothetical protein